MFVNFCLRSTVFVSFTVIVQTLVSLFVHKLLIMSPLFEKEFETSTFFLSTTTVADDSFDYVRLVWIIPLVAGVVVVLFLLAFGLFYCVRHTELFVLKCCMVFNCCCRQKEREEEYINLNETHRLYNENYTINGNVLHTVLEVQSVP